MLFNSTILEYITPFCKILSVYIFSKLFYLSQNCINHKNSCNKFEDRTFELTKKIHNIFQNNMILTKGLFILTSLIIDIFHIILVLDYILNDNFDEVKILICTFIIRQISQYFVSFPQPEGILWTYPGFKSIFVTYEITNDFYFSGHTSISVICLMFLQRNGYSFIGYLNLGLQIFTLIVTRSHYFPDIMTGYMTGYMTPYFVKYILGI
jgi:hypothetical protein